MLTVVAKLLCHERMQPYPIPQQVCQSLAMLDVICKDLHAEPTIEHNPADGVKNVMPAHSDTKRWHSPAHDTCLLGITSRICIH